jgi:hypothetical protein
MRAARMLLLALVVLGVWTSVAQAGRCGDTACRADLSVSGHAEPQPIHVGERSEFKFTVQDNGPDTALAVKLQVRVSSGVKIVDALAYGGQSCSVDGTFVQCDIGDLVKLQQAVVRVRVQGVSTGTFSGRADVFGYDIEDPNGGNNQVTATLGVIPVGASGGTTGTPSSSGGLSLTARDPQSILRTGGVTIRAVVPRTGTLRLRGSVRTASGKVALVGVARGVRAGETVSVFMGTTAGALSRIRTGLRSRSRLPVDVLVTLGSLKAKIQLHVKR